MGKKMMQCREYELLDSLVVRIEPTDEKGKIVCVDSSDKYEIGSNFEFLKTFHIYLVNNSDHDIESVKSERRDYGRL